MLRYLKHNQNKGMGLQLGAENSDLYWCYKLSLLQMINAKLTGYQCKDFVYNSGAILWDFRQKDNSMGSCNVFLCWEL